MDSDQKDICRYLKGWPGIFVAHREIARRAAGKRRYRDDPNWASTALTRLVEQGVLESDSTGHFRLKALQPKEPPKRWVSPQIQRILERGGKTFELADQEEEPI
jgi:hypothetical protein